ncbi:TPA: restriction endonuclease subunit S [Pasteurella multocida]|nr:restriction endonuclease subunit S [Pasteurella multocida]
MWVRLNDIFYLQAGKFIPSSEIHEENNGDLFPCFGGNGLRGFVKNYNREGDFPLIGRQGALCGNVNLGQGKFYATEHAVVVETFAHTNVKWAIAFLTHINLNQYATATAQPGLAVSKINEVLIPLPPLNEQKRIVAKIEELLPFVEQYAKKEQELTALYQNFPEQLKKSILQAAIQGKLTEQNPYDEPASVLIEHIQAEKEQLIAEKKIKKPKQSSRIIRRDNSHYEIMDGVERCIDDELPCEIPENWCWVRLSQLGEIIGGGTPKTDNDINWLNGNIPWITPADMKNVKGKYISKGERNITSEGLNSSSAKMLSKNSIVYSSRAPIGYVAITNDLLCTNQGFKSIDLYKKDIVDYLYYGLIYFTPLIQSRASGTTFKEISGTEFGNIVIPLPPFNEQKRIVEKIESIFSQIDHL